MKAMTIHFDPREMDNFSIIENGLNLNPEINSRIKRKLTQLELRAPSNSSILLSFRKINSIIVGRLLINSNGRKFEANLKGADPYRLYLQLESKVDKQLLLWKNSRMFESFINTSQGVCVNN